MTEQEFDEMSEDYMMRLDSAQEAFTEYYYDYDALHDILRDLHDLHFNQDEPLTISQMTKRTHKIRCRLNDFDNELQVLYQEVQRIKWELDNMARGMCEEYKRKVKESKDD